MNLFFVTGDTHGDLTRIKNFSTKMELTSNDVIIILGDVGINYFGDRCERKEKFRYNNYGPTLFCIHGNHESRACNFPAYKEKEWNGGIVYYEDEFPNILFAKDGEIYDFDGKKCMPIGGAYSVDKWYRILRTYQKHRDIIKHHFSKRDYEEAILFVQGKIEDPNFNIRNKLDNLYKYFPNGTCTWFSDEQPSDEIKKYVEKQVSQNNIDIIFSHTCPSKYIPTEMFLGFVNQNTVDNSTEEWLDKIEEQVNYEKWFCGHWHTNKKIDKLVFLFEDFVEL